MNKLITKVFIDGGIPEETRSANELFSSHFGYALDGQTTNPSLIAKNLKSKMQGTTMTSDMATEEYKKIVQEFSSMLPTGSVSIQVFANKDTLAEEMIAQAKDRITWIPNASIKLPCTHEGLKAASVISSDMPVNITLVFSQAQAAAVYEATKHAKHPVFLSPFVGRLDDTGVNGMQLIENILKLYTTGDGHVEVLTASVRTIEHILYALQLRSHIITLPFKAFEPWAQKGFPQPDEAFRYSSPLSPIPYRNDITLGKEWTAYDLQHELTTKGLEMFWADWTSIFS